MWSQVRTDAMSNIVDAFNRSILDFVRKPENLRLALGRGTYTLPFEELDLADQMRGFATD